MNKYIQRLIKEQFSVSDLDFSDNEQEYSVNIFNKNFKHQYYEKVLNGTVTESEIKELDSLIGVVVPNDKNELQKIIEFYSKNYPEDSLNWLNVSGITDMSHLFEETLYDGDISKWDTSNVTNMQRMFHYAIDFNQPIGDWNVSGVTDMCGMFRYAEKFNQDISKWNTSKVVTMERMFENAQYFNHSIGKWDVSNVTDMSYMFYYAYNFNCPIGRWVVSKVTDMHYMFFYAAKFNQPIDMWDVSSVTDMGYMFFKAYSFDQYIGRWNISDNTNIDSIFQFCPIKEEYKPIKCR